MEMTHSEIREKFLKFFESRGHKIVPSSSLLPTDPSVLFTTAGMQQFKPYYTNPENAPAKNVVSIQKSFRTSSIDEVGDDSHLTFFEMLGNFSFGGYWKREAIQYAYEFITQEMGLKIDYVSVFAGEGDIPADEESEKIWKSIDPDLKIKRLGREDNFWGPTGEEGPCGPSTEIFVKGIEYEIWNIVFNEFYCSKDKKFTPSEVQGIDTGMGLERLTSAVQKKKNIFETDLFEELIGSLPDHLDLKTKRIIADHSRAIVFLVGEGVVPSNKEQGYVLRRLMRRIMAHQVSKDVLDIVINIYSGKYPELQVRRNEIHDVYSQEFSKFDKTLRNGLNELKRLEKIDSGTAFKLYESFGLPYELIKDAGKDKAKDLTREAFEEEFRKHQEKSRAGAEKKFGGHGIKEGDLTAADAEEMKKKTRLHTATHILFAALKKVLGQELPQAGSDITTERLRFDFTFSRKLTPEELKQAEDIANKVIEDDLPVAWKEMDLQEALNSGASAFFKLKYPPKVKVYTIGDENHPFSRELCGGPHVSRTGEIGKITITKEESVSGGRRIRATVD